MSFSFIRNGEYQMLILHIVLSNIEIKEVRDLNTLEPKINHNNDIFRNI